MSFGGNTRILTLNMGLYISLDVFFSHRNYKSRSQTRYSAPIPISTKEREIIDFLIMTIITKGQPVGKEDEMTDDASDLI